MQKNSVEIADEIVFAESEERIRACYPVMRQLRPHLDDEQKFIAQVKRQIEEGYNLAYLQEGGRVRALAGFRFLEFLAWGRVLYIDAHFHNILTDGERFYFSGFGLAISSQFTLSKEESEFFNTHSNYDRYYVATKLTNWIVSNKID